LLISFFFFVQCPPPRISEDIPRPPKRHPNLLASATFNFRFLKFVPATLALAYFSALCFIFSCKERSKPKFPERLTSPQRTNFEPYRIISLFLCTPTFVKVKTFYPDIVPNKKLGSTLFPFACTLFALPFLNSFTLQTLQVGPPLRNLIA